MVSPTVIQKYVNLGGIIVVSLTVIQKYVNLGGIIVVILTVIQKYVNLGKNNSGKFYSNTEIC